APTSCGLMTFPGHRKTSPSRSPTWPRRPRGSNCRTSIPTSPTTVRNGQHRRIPRWWWLPRRNDPSTVLPARNDQRHVGPVPLRHQPHAVDPLAIFLNELAVGPELNRASIWFGGCEWTRLRSQSVAQSLWNRERDSGTIPSLGSKASPLGTW